MTTSFSKEMEESCSTILNQLEKMIRQLGGDRAKDSGLDSVGRLNISLFYDGNSDWWIGKAEEIFARNQLSEREKVEAAVACWCGEAWEWFLCVDRHRPVQTRKELKGLMLDRFRLPIREKSPEPTFGSKISIKSDEASMITEGKKGREETWPVDNCDQKLFNSLTGINPSVGGKEQAFHGDNSVNRLLGEERIFDLNQISKWGEIETAPRGAEKKQSSPEEEKSVESEKERKEKGVEVFWADITTTRREEDDTANQRPSWEENGDSGLKELGGTEVKRLESHGLGQFMNLAQLIEDRKQSLKRAQLNSSPHGIKYNFYSPNSIPITYSPTNKISNPHYFPSVTPYQVPLHPTNKISLGRAHVLEKPQWSAMGYGVSMDNILVILGPVNKSSNRLGPGDAIVTSPVIGIFTKEIMWIYNEFNFFHLEDKVDLEGRVMIDPQFIDSYLLGHILECSLVG